MTKSIMRTFTIGDVQYEIYDAVARNAMSTLQSESSKHTTNINSILRSISTLEQEVDSLQGGSGSGSGSSVSIDKTLSVSGAAADAKTTGDRIAQLNTSIGNLSDAIEGLEGGTGTTGSSSVQSVNNKTPDSSGNITLTSEDIGDLYVGGTAGQILTVDSSGNIVTSNRTVNSLGTGVTYQLSGTTLYITTAE